MPEEDPDPELLAISEGVLGDPAEVFTLPQGLSRSGAPYEAA